MVDIFQHPTRSLGGTSECRKTLAIMTALLFKKAASFSEYIPQVASAAAESDSLQNLQWKTVKYFILHFFGVETRTKISSLPAKWPSN